MRSVRLILLAASLAASGCFAYIPSSPQEVAPGQPLRLRLSAEAAARYQDLRLANSRLLEGTLVSRSASELMVEASVGVNDATRDSRALVQQVSVPLSGILEVELKRLDGFKTGLLVAGGGALLTVAIIKGGGGSGSKHNPPDDTPDARRIPLIRFSLPLGGR